MASQATDINKLMVMVEANTRSYERAMKKLETVTNQAAKNSAKGFDPVKRVLEDVENRSGRAGGQIVRMEREIAAAAAKAVTPLKLNNAQLQNMQFQISDLAQGLATGNQSPFTLIAQQGSQIAQIFGPGASVTSAFKATGAAIASFITNPINLAVIGIAAATAAAPMIWEAFNGSAARSSKDILADIDDLLQRITKNNERAAEAIEKYTNRQESGAILLRDSLKATDEAAKVVADTLVRIGDLLDSDAFKEFGSDEVRQLQQETATLFEQFSKGQMTARDLDESLARLRINRELSNDADAFLRQMELIVSETVAAQGALDKLRIAQEKISNPPTIANIDGQRFGDGTLLGGELTETLNRELRSSRRDRGIKEKRGKTEAEREAEKKARQIEREQKAINELIKSLEIERELIGATDIERQVANSTRNLGASATDEQKAKIESLTESLLLEQRAWEAVNDAQDFFADTLGDNLISIIDGTKSASDGFRDMAKAIANAALQASLLGKGPLSGMFGTSQSGGFLGQIISGMVGGGNSGPIILPGGRGMAGGGSVQANMPRMVGERGAELFIPNTAGKIVANSNLSGSTVIRLDLSPDVEARVMQKSRGQAVEIVQQSAPAMIDASVSKTGENIGNGNMDGAMARYGSRPQTRRVG